jgi:hypothetical protein
LKQDKHLTPFKSVWQLASLRTSDEVYTFRPYGTLDGSDVSITFTDYDATEGTVSILVDTEGMDVRKMSDGSLVLRGEGLLVDGSTEYVFAEGTMLAGLAFILNGADDSSTATVEIKTGAEVFEHKLSTSSSWAKAISPLSLGSMAESEEKEIDIRVSSYFSQPTSADSYEALFVVEDGASGSTDAFATMPVHVNIIDSEDDSLIVRASVYPNEDPESEADAQSDTTSLVSYGSTQLDVTDPSRFITGGVVSVTDGTYTDYYQITSKTSSSLIVTSLENDGLGNNGSQHTDYSIGSTVKPVTGRNDMIGKYKEFGITFS